MTGAAKGILSILVSVICLSVLSVPSVADMKSWQKAVVKKVAKSQTYPRSALSREIEGRAKIRLVVDATGEITEHEVVEPTGENLLDREIPRLVKRLNPLPSLPDGRESLTFILPLSWTLD